jgi:hypothetical protein
MKYGPASGATSETQKLILRRVLRGHSWGRKNEPIIPDALVVLDVSPEAVKLGVWGGEPGRGPACG